MRDLGQKIETGEKEKEGGKERERKFFSQTTVSYERVTMKKTLVFTVAPFSWIRATLSSHDRRQNLDLKGKNQ